ncbi:MAG: TolC family protein, partial [Rhodobacterales bacterium]|nr:TolC family protein [Rhodobacterales bacterium]
AVFLFGTRAYINLPRESAPDITIPVVLITTPYQGVSPQDIETLISIPLENELTSLRDIEKLSSSSSEGISVVSIEFAADVQIDEALQKVRDRVSRVKPKLPDDITEPSVREISFSDIPVLLVTLSGPNEDVLVELAEDLEDAATRLDSVLDADVSGGIERQIRVQIDPARLSHYGLSLSDVQGAISNENVNIPGGNVMVGGGDFLLRTPGQFETAHEIEEVAIKRVGDIPVFIRDIASVLDGKEDRVTYSRLNGKPSVTVSITKRSGANILSVAQSVKATVAIQSETWPENVTYSVLADQSENIAQSVSDLQNNILTALILVVAVIVVFMGLRNSLLVGLAIPLSMLMSFLVLEVLGFTLNMVVLFSLILALGMLVDNGIVVVENVYRHLEMGKPPREASIDGTSEVAVAVTASTATTAAAFFPLVFWTGIMGEFMGFLPKTIIIVLVSSLIVAIGVLPVVMAKVLKTPEVVNNEKSPMRDRELGTLMSAYRSLLRFSIRYKWFSAGSGVGTFIVTVGFFALFNNGSEFFPETDPERAVVGITLPVGADLDATDRVVRQIEPLISEEVNVESWVAEVGVSAGGQALTGFNAAPNQARITVDFKPSKASAKPGEQIRQGKSEDSVSRLRKAMSVIPGARVTIEPESMGPPVGKPISVQVVGDDFHSVGEVAQQFRRKLANLPGTTDLSDNYKVGRPELRLRIDRGAAKLVGVSTAQVGNAVRTAVAGTKASTLRDGEEEIDIIVELAPQFRQDVQSVLDLRIPGRADTSPNTFPVPLSAVAGWDLVGGSGTLNHLDQDLVVTIEGDVAVGFNENAVRAELNTLIAGFETPEGIYLTQGGASDDQAESAAFLQRAFLIAVVLISMVLVTQFDSITTPLIIMATVFLSMIGVLWGLVLTHTPFGIIMTGLGVISLAGVVVNNAIVLLDYVEQLREQGLPVEEALIEAGLTRFRPVMLTAITTTLGLLPMAIAIGFDFSKLQWVVGGASAQMWGPMAIAVIFGLSFATLLTLVMVPTLYSILDQLRLSSRSVRSMFTKTVGIATALSLAVLFLPAPAQAVTLEEAWSAAENHNLQLKISTESVVQSKATTAKAWSSLSPRGDVSATYVLNNQEIVLDMSEGLDPALAAVSGITPITIQEKAFWQAEAGVSQRFFSGTALPGIRGATLATKSAKYTLQHTKNQLKETVASSYFGLLNAREIKRIAEAQLDTATHQLELADRQVAAGMASRRVAIQARLGVAQAKRQVSTAHQSVVDAQIGFEMITGLSQSNLEVPASVVTPTSVESALVQAKTERSDLRAAATQAKAMSFQRTAYDLQWLPVVDGRFAYIFSENTGFQSDPWTWRATLTARWDFWDGGVRVAEQIESRSFVRQAQLTELALMDQAEREIRVAFEGLKGAEHQLDAVVEELALAEENVELAELSFTAGSTTWLEVEQADLMLLQARLGQLSARRARELAAIHLLAATGAL